jgi:DnaJ-class molecular chaperone
MDPYTVLGINNNASEKEIKNAYKKLAREHHPDKGGSEEKFKEIGGAYTQIMKGSDPLDDFPDISEIFNMFVKRKDFFKGPKVTASLRLSLKELELGGTFNIKYIRNIPSGEIIQSTANTPFGMMNIMIPEEIKREYEIQINVPKCYDTRNPLIIKNAAVGDNVPSSDLEIIIIVSDHKIYKRISGTLDLQTVINVSLKEALTGFTRELQLLNSNENITVECDSIIDPYTTKTIEGYGLMISEQIKGNLILKFNIVFPIVLSKETKDKLIELL